MFQNCSFAACFNWAKHWFQKRFSSRHLRVIYQHVKERVVWRAVSKIVMGIKNSIQLEEKRIIPADAAHRDRVWPMVNAVTSKSSNRIFLKTNGSDMATKNSK